MFALLPSGWEPWGFAAALIGGLAWLIGSWWVASQAAREGHGFAGFLALSLLATPIVGLTALQYATGPLFVRRPPGMYLVFVAAYLAVFALPLVPGDGMHTDLDIGAVAAYLAVLLLLAGGSRFAWVLVMFLSLLFLPLMPFALIVGQFSVASALFTVAIAALVIVLLTPTMRAHRNPPRGSATTAGPEPA